MNNVAAFILSAMTLNIAVPGSVQEPDEPPPVFATLSFDEAVSRTKGTEEILVVKATAVWCQPCKMMDRTTWRDDRVVAWFNKHGLAIQFDVDKERDLAKKLTIEAMPTMVAFVKGKEFDRIVGYKTAAELLAWVEGVKNGKRSIEAVRQRAELAPPGAKEEVDARYDLAKALARSGNLDEATDEFAWLWVNSKNVPSYGGVRGSFMASKMERLALRYVPARERFTKFRDEAGERIKGEKVDPEDLSDWIVLNGVVGESEKTLEWFSRVKAEARWLPLIRRVSFRIERLLEAKGRWADIAEIYPDPIGELRRRHALLQMSMRSSLPEELRDRSDEMRVHNERMFREKAGKLYAVMLAAGRETDAQRVFDEAIKLDDSATVREMLVSWALRAKQPRSIQFRLLDEAEKGGEVESVEKLRQKLRKALLSEADSRLDREGPGVRGSPQEFEVGFPEEFAVGQVDERFKASGVWIVREEEGFYVLSTICTRLGCTVDWLTSEQKFVCPCFGSSFLKTGINIAGDAPRPLERFKIVMADDGQLRIDKNTKYQEEKGQWVMDGAFLIYP